MEDIQNYLRVLSDTLTQKQDVMAQILKITKWQEQLAAAESLDEESFSNSVNEKEILIAKLNQLDEGFLSVYNRIRQDVIAQGGLYDPEIHKMQEQIKACVNIGNDIEVLEERNHARLTSHFTAKKQEYKVKASANSAARSYHQTMAGVQYRDPFFMDQKK